MNPKQYWTKLLPEDTDIEEFLTDHQIIWNPEEERFEIRLTEYVLLGCSSPDWKWIPYSSQSVMGLTPCWPEPKALLDESKILAHTIEDCLYLRALKFNAVWHPGGPQAWIETQISLLGKAQIITLWPSSTTLSSDRIRVSRAAEILNIEAKHTMVLGDIRGKSHDEIQELIDSSQTMQIIPAVVDCFRQPTPSFEPPEHVPDRGFIHDYYLWQTSATDAPDCYAVANAIFCISAVLGRRYKASTKLPHIFMILIGPSAEGRKTTAQSCMEQVLRPIVFEPMSWPGLEDNRGNPTKTKKCSLYIPEDITMAAMYDQLVKRPFGVWRWGELRLQFAQFKNARHQAGAKDWLNMVYDGRTFEKQIRGAQWEPEGQHWTIPNPYLLIHAATQTEYLERYAEWGDLISGFFGRFMCVLSCGRTRTIPPSQLKEPSEIPAMKLTQWLEDMIEGIPFHQEKSLKWENPLCFDSWYFRNEEDASFQDTSVQPFFKRMQDHYIKSAICYQASFGSLEEGIITEEACHYAQAWCRFLISSAQRISYRHIQDPQQKIYIQMLNLYNRHQHLKFDGLIKLMRGFDRDDIANVFKSLIDMGELELRDGKETYGLR